MRVLIADEDAPAKRLLTRILVRDFSCTVGECGDGLEALDLLARHRYDLLVLDLSLPFIGGLEVLEAVRYSETLAQLPVVVLTSVRHEADVRRAVELGVSAYITKPLRPADVAERLARVIADATPMAGRLPPRTLAGLPPGSRVMVVDGDRDYRHFVRATLGQEYVVLEAESGAQGLRTCLQHQPAVVLLGVELGLLSRKVFLQKLRQIPQLANVAVVLSSNRRDDARQLDCDGVVTRSFVPDTLKQQFAALVAPPPSRNTGAVAGAEVWRDALSATEQVFGMMLGVTVCAESGSQPALSDDEDLSYVVLSVDRLGDLVVGIASPRTSGVSMTQAFLQGADPVGDADVADTLQELANLVGGRVLDGLRSRGLTARMGLPVVTRVKDRGRTLAESHWRARFSDTDGQMSFTVSIADLDVAAAEAS